MKKVIVLIVIVAFVMLVGPKIVQEVSKVFEKQYDITGDWRVVFNILDEQYNGYFEFRKGRKVTAGSVWHNDSKVGDYLVEDKTLRFEIDFDGIRDDGLRAVFNGVITEQEFRDELSGTFTGTRIVLDMEVETGGDWRAEK